VIIAISNLIKFGAFHPFGPLKSERMLTLSIFEVRLFNWFKLILLLWMELKLLSFIFSIKSLTKFYLLKETLV